MNKEDNLSTKDNKHVHCTVRIDSKLSDGLLYFQSGPPETLSLKHRGKLNPALADYRSSALMSPRPLVMTSSSDLLTPAAAVGGFKTPNLHTERAAKATMFSSSDAQSPRQQVAVPTMDTPLNRGGQGLPAKPHILQLAQSSDDCVQDTGVVGQVKLESGQEDSAGHSSPGQPKSVLGHIKSGDAGHSTPPGRAKPELGHGKSSGHSDPSSSGQKKASEETRKLRQAQLQEEWKKKRGGVAQAASSTPGDELVAELSRYEKELVSNGMTVGL